MADSLALELKGITKTFGSTVANKDVDSLSVKCENNIEFEKSGIKKKFSQFFYRLKPLNIANTFYYEHN